MYLSDEITLILIVPEVSVLTDEGSCEFVWTKLEPLIEVSKKVWKASSVELIQSGLEGDSFIGIEQFKANESITKVPFCIIDKKQLDKVSFTKTSNLNYEYLEREGILILDKSFLCTSN